MNKTSPSACLVFAGRTGSSFSLLVLFFPVLLSFFTPDPAPAPDNTLTLADSCPDIVIKKVRGLGSLPQGAVVVTASEWWCWNDNERRVEEQECQIKKLNKEIASLKEKNSENMEWEKNVILLNVDKDQAFEKGYKSGLRVGLDYAAPHTHCDGCGRQYRYVA